MEEKISKLIDRIVALENEVRRLIEKIDNMSNNNKGHGQCACQLELFKDK